MPAPTSPVKIDPVLRRGQIATVETGTGPETHDVGLVGAGYVDDLSRKVYCVLGMPIDAIDMATVLRRIEAAAIRKASFLISTPNLNFLVNSRLDPEFRESLLDSDLCPADGMPIVWIGRLTGVPIETRVSGADIFEALKAPARRARRLRVFLFGGPAGVAAAAAGTLNSVLAGLSCVGTIDPGFGTVEEMSRDEILASVNASDADLLAVSLGAKKGQLWLRRNHERLTIPVRAHLGAALNFHAGTVKRAPLGVRAWGFEWLWRIKEEPYLWRRYWNDGRVLLRLLVTRVLPLVIATRWHRLNWQRQGDLVLKLAHDQEAVTVSLCGAAVERHVAKVVSYLREALTGRERAITINLSETRVIDARFFGLLLMLRKQLKRRGTSLQFIGISRPMARMFRLNELEFLFAANQGV
jgi:N-acetylglucosaminyldiphosphoundecaprenol N-acetyl-beta-D-mannosaminyltransferase